MRLLLPVPPSPARPSAEPRRVPGAQPRALPVLVLLAVAACGVLLFLVGLGATGVVDETPAVFAASARAMAQSGDWLIPRINGLPRYDKPPLVHWLMGALYALPDQAWWNPLGSWAARLPSALASMALMLVLAQTLLRWPQAGPRAGERAGDASAAAGAARRWRAAHAVTAFNAALAFAPGPPAWLWGRTEVSDALFSALLGCALLLAWRSYATEQDCRATGCRPRQPHVLLVIDAQTAAEPHWHGIRGQELGRAGPYRLLRLERRWLERRARELEREGRRPSWREPRMERL